MRNPALSFLLTSLVVCSSLATAQKTIIVDKANGPGTHYKTLGAAITAAKSGDILRLRAGTYLGPESLSKPLTIQGTTGVKIQLPGTIFFGKPIRIHGLSTGQTIAFRDVTFFGTNGANYKPAMLQVDSTKGLVVFDSTVLSNNRYGSIGVLIQKSTQVHLRNCKIDGVVSSTSSKVMVEGGSFIGHDAYAVPHMAAIPGEPAFDINGGELSLTDVTAKGGNGNVKYTWLSPPPAVRVKSATVLLRGKGSKLSAGAKAGSSASAIAGTKSKLVYDSVVTLTPSGKGVAISGFTKVIKKSLPTLRSANDPTQGQSFNYTLSSQANQNFALVVGLPGLINLFPDQEALLLDVKTMIPIVAGMQKAMGETAFAVVVPKLATLTGWTFMMQGIAGTAAPELANAIEIGVR